MPTITSTATRQRIDDPLLTTRELSQLIRINEKTLTNWRYLHIGPPYVRFGRRVFYRHSAVTAYLTSGEVETCA